MQFNKKKLSEERLLSLYKAIIKPRLIEEKMLILLRQGKISKWFSGIGQEAISVGVTSCLKDSEYILPMHRNLGVFTTRKIPLNRLFAQWQGKESGFTKGRDRSFHFGTQEHNLVGMISHLGPQLGVAVGIALANKLKQKKQATVVFTGEGGTSEGDFHEALNLASVWDLPVLFVIENNGYGLSTPTSQQYRAKKLSHRGKGYGMEAHTIDGNNVLEVYNKVSKYLKKIRNESRPILLEMNTFRRRGHEEASGTKYVPEELMKYWESKDPVNNYEKFLLDEGILTKQIKNIFVSDIKKEIDDNLNVVNKEKVIEPSLERELNDVYAKHTFRQIKPKGASEEMRFVDAISNGLREGMSHFKNSVLMGQDVAEYGGVFKITDGFIARFGKDRIRNTPICESAVISAAMGLVINGYKAIVEMQFADFASTGFNPIVNLLAKSHYRWGQDADVVIRMPCGGGVGAGPFHSQTNEAWFTKTPGLKVVYPAFPIDAKGLLISAMEDPNPVLFFEHKGLYRSIRQYVPLGYYNIPLGEAAIIQEGNDISIITYGAAVHWVMEEVKDIAYSIEVVDLRTLLPLDEDSIKKTVKKTGKVLIVHEDSLYGGIGAEVSAIISENCFEYLDAPIRRIASLDTPIPFAKQLENQYLVKRKIKKALLELLAY